MPSHNVFPSNDELPTGGLHGVATLLETPFDIALVPANLLAADAPGQEVTMASALASPDTVGDDVMAFSAERVSNLPLHRLEAWSNDKNPLAMDALGSRKTITYTGSCYTIRADDGNLHWTVDKTYMDLLVCVGGGLGLGPLLPGPEMPVLHTYRFGLNLGRPSCQFTAKYAKLGFDPMDSMLWIGQLGSTDDVWLTFVPRSFVDSPSAGEYNDNDETAHWRGRRSTTLSRDHYRCVVMLLANMLHSINFLDITLVEEYPDIADNDEFKFATNLL